VTDRIVVATRQQEFWLLPSFPALFPLGGQVGPKHHLRSRLRIFRDSVLLVDQVADLKQLGASPRERRFWRVPWSALLGYPIHLDNEIYEVAPRSR